MKTQGILIAIFLSVFSTGLLAQSFDFRNTTWGMDTLQVKKTETSKLLASKKTNIIYSGKLGDLDARIVYDFNSSAQLFHAAYLVIVNSRNPQTFVTTYLMLQDLLTKKYKEPALKLNSTINGKVITQDEWASNLISDNLNFETKWMTDKSEIVLTLFIINDAPCIEINYNSRSAAINNEKNSVPLKDL